MKRFLSARFLGAVALLGVLVVVVGVGVSMAKQKVEQAIRQNFTAAGLLSRIQVQGEKMRRYEKEMFIYAAVPASRIKYVKEFDEAHTKLLALLTEAGMPGNRAFSDDERQQISAWTEATAYYTSEFLKIAGTADAIAIASLSAEDRATLAVRFNNDIKQGKDRFATLLSGAAKLREDKEQASLGISTEIDNVFDKLLYLVTGVALVLLAGVALTQPRRLPVHPATTQARRSQLGPASAV